MSRPIVAIFLKAPVAGRVKTRLAATCGTEEAVRLYREWLTRIFTQLQPLRPEVRLIGYYDGDLALLDSWHSSVDDWVAQPAGDLGVRLAHLFRHVHPPGGSASPCIAIGSDCLTLTADRLLHAFTLLKAYDTILGPAPDGGYYLIGLRRGAPDLFNDIRWSGPWTRLDQERNVRAAGLSLGWLDEQPDIDTWDDWQRFLQSESGQ